VPAQFFEYRVRKVDKRQIKKGDHRNTLAAKKRRKILHGQKKKRTTQKEKEGTTYKAGAF
jgi:hypothetical protein